MPTFEELRNDHKALRRALTRCRGCLSASKISEVGRLRLCALVNRLSDYLRREGELVSPYASQVQTAVRGHAVSDPAEPQIVLRDLEVCCSAWRTALTEARCIHLHRLLDELRERLDEEERDLFPVLQHAAKIRIEVR